MFGVTLCRDCQAKPVQDNSDLFRLERLIRDSRYKEAYELSFYLYRQSEQKSPKPLNFEEQNNLSKILAALATAEFRLGKITDAKEHIDQVIMLIHDTAPYRQNLEYLHDLGAALVLKGDIIIADKKDYRQALVLYNLAYKLTDADYPKEMLGDLYYKLAKYSLLSGDRFFYIHFRRKHEKLLGVDHPKSLELYEID